MNRSKSFMKNSSTHLSITKTLDYLPPHCKLEGCSASIIVEVILLKLKNF